MRMVPSFSQWRSHTTVSRWRCGRTKESRHRRGQGQPESRRTSTSEHQRGSGMAVPLLRMKQSARHREPEMSFSRLAAARLSAASGSRARGETRARWDCGFRDPDGRSFIYGSWGCFLWGRPPPRPDLEVDQTVCTRSSYTAEVQLPEDSAGQDCNNHDGHGNRGSICFPARWYRLYPAIFEVMVCEVAAWGSRWCHILVLYPRQDSMRLVDRDNAITEDVLLVLVNEGVEVIGFRIRELLCSLGRSSTGEGRRQSRFR
nr:hypothetical protein CFP56_07985 [Quercus suber]